jgi:uncharacterized protein
MSVANGEQVLTADHVLEYPYSRSVGPVIGAFLTALRDGRVVGARAADGRVIVPPAEYDPDTGDDCGEIVDVGPEGTVLSWSWVPRPRPKHPMRDPFAWVLVRFDGADTSMLHVLAADGPERVHTGMRVRPEFLPPGERRGSVLDIAHFSPVEGGS